MLEVIIRLKIFAQFQLSTVLRKTFLSVSAMSVSKSVGDDVWTVYKIR